MNDSSPTSNQSATAPRSSFVRVQIPDIAPANSRQDFESTSKIEVRNTSSIDSLQQAIQTPATAADLQNLAHPQDDFAPKKVDRLIDSILQRFPHSHPTTIIFVGTQTDAQTDKVATDVAQRLTERRVGKVLLVDSNPNSQELSSGLHLEKSAGIGNVICDDQPWQDLLQAGPVNDLDFLPYGDVNTSKAVRSRTTNFLNSTKEIYQFICVSVGLNHTPISKTFCNAADGIYLLIDLKQISHFEAKAAVDKFKLNNQPLIGCIALDAEQE